LRDHCIGFNPVERRVSIPGSDRNLCVPEGITIPLWHDSTNTLYGINVRLSRNARVRWEATTGRDAKYVLASGSKRAPLGLESLRGKSHALVLEGEFDTLL